VQRVIFPAFILAILVGCATHTSVPDTRYYTLEYAPPEVSGRPVRAVVALNHFGVAPEFNTHRLIYRDLAFGRQDYAYHQWRAVPQTLLMDHLRRDLRESGLFLAVVGPGSSLPPTHRIEGILEEWMEVDTDQHWLADAAVTITLLDARTGDSTEMVLFQKTYRESVPADRKNPASIADAMSRAVQKISAQVIADVHAAVSEQQSE
jgi:ABC-type uncharacterized transport system auxiliary subunit